MRIVVRERMTMVCSSSTGTVVRVCLGQTRSLERGGRGCELVLWTTTLVERSGTIHRWTWGLHDCGHCTAGQLWMRQWGSEGLDKTYIIHQWPYDALRLYSRAEDKQWTI